MAEVTPSQPKSASSEAASTAAQRSSPAPPKSSSVRQQQDRIEEILDLGRRRSLQFASRGRPQHQQDDQMAHSRHQSSLYSDHEGNAGESSADEQTAIMRRDSARRTDYLTNATSKTSGTASNGRRSGSSRRTEHNEQAVRDEAPPGEVEGSESWWKRQIEKYGSVELENKGSVARDHLALERTFLAWLRTSLAFASIGIAITQLFRLNSSIRGSSDTADPYLHLRQLGKPLGATFLGVSILVLFIGFHRYFESQHWIIRGKFPASRGSVALVAFVAFALMVTSLVVVLVVEPSAFEKRSEL